MPRRAARPSAPRGAATASARAPTAAGYLPPNFQPYSVTWDSLSTGWVIGPAGTPGHCANAATPTSARRSRAPTTAARPGSGLPAPDTGGPDGATGVSGIRFLDGANGWAFGPELWATDDGGKTWTQVDTGGQRVTDLETAGDRAYALFAQLQRDQLRQLRVRLHAATR